MRLRYGLVGLIVVAALGLVPIMSALGGEANRRGDESYLDCRWQEQVSIMAATTFPTMDAALTLTIGADVPIPPGFEDLVTVLESNEDATSIGVANLAVAEVITSPGGEFAVSAYAFCSPVVPPGEK